MRKQFFLLGLVSFIFWAAPAQVHYFVAKNGNDANSGTLAKPFKTVEAALQKALQQAGEAVVIEIRGGDYELRHAIEINATNYQARSLTIRGYANEKVVIKGSKQITPQWRAWKNGIMIAKLPLEAAPDRLFLDGQPLPMARYPNYDSNARVFNGTAADAIADARVSSWQHPEGGYIHALHNGEWGDFHYRITGKDAAGKLLYEGGWQNNRPAPMHPKYRFVENILEELDAPGEWFYDKGASTLYYYPLKTSSLKKAKFAVSQLTDLVHITGSNTVAIKNIRISNLQFTQTSRTFMLTKEPLLRSDWTIYRGAAILLQGTENITIRHCNFSALGGNAVFLSNYNRADSISNNHLYNIGGSALLFVGNPAAVRSPAFRYEYFEPWTTMDFTPGPKSNDYPQYCLAAGNLIHHIGTVEKQVAGVQIEMSAHITVIHNTIYTVPRSGINIGDGCWGGHDLAFNDVFNTVLETGDHGAFNSWGRDRFWRPERNIIDSIVAAKPGIELLDVMDTITIRNNRFQCDHGWDIDLDDGSSNYHIYNNVCLSGGLKLREGYHRTVNNNILVNNTFHPHVWLKNSGDIFTHNIVTSPYAPILMNSWGSQVDNNFFLYKDGLDKAQALGLDKSSAWGNALFVSPAKGNYTVKAGSPALQTGFENFDMHFGVTDPGLRKLAASPPFKPLMTTVGETKGAVTAWLGANFKNIETLGERSAAGLHNNNGVLLAELPDASIAAKNGLQKGDVIVAMNDQPVHSIGDLLKVYQNIKWMGRAGCTIVRNQQQQTINIAFNKE